MTRTKFRQLWMLVVGMMMLATSYSYNNFKEIGDNIKKRNIVKNQLEVDLLTGSQMISALDELDSVTLDESKSTRLDVLRYMGVESSNFKIFTENPVKKTVIGTDVFVRKFKLTGKLPYTRALDQADLFHNLKKVNLQQVLLKPADGYGDIVDIEMKGAIYGLQK